MMNGGLSHVLTIDRVARHLLVLCQDSHDANAIEAILQQQDYQATMVRSPGQAALAVLNRGDIDVMICDGRMRLGREEERMFHRVRLNLEPLGIPLLMLLDPDNDSQWALADKLATDEFMLKPMREEEFLWRLKGLLWRKENRAGRGGRSRQSDLLQGFMRYVRNDLEAKSEVGASASLALVEAVGAWDLMRAGDTSCDRLTDQLFEYLASNLRRVDRVVRGGRVTLIVYMPGRSRGLVQEALQLYRAEFSQQTGSSFCVGLAVCPDDGTSYTELVLSADHELTRARSNGSGTTGLSLSAAARPPSSHRILIADDDPFLVAPLKATFDALGYQTLATENGREALQLILWEQPELAILGQRLPELTGFELLEQLRAHNGAQLPVPVILLTIMTAHSDVIRGLELGVEDYVGKPFNPCELIARAERVLSSRPSFLRVGC